LSTLACYRATLVLARAQFSWMFAALNTIEPPILELSIAKFQEADKPWTKERLPLVENRVRDRLVKLSSRLGDSEWLDGAFSAGDLLMVSVLLRLKTVGPTRSISRAGRLCRPRRSAARVQAGCPISGACTASKCSSSSRFDVVSEKQIRAENQWLELPGRARQLQ
jgi:glutathione S-transferase